MAIVDQIRTVDCRASRGHSLGIDGVAWCALHQVAVYAYHVCDNHESEFVVDCENLQSTRNTQCGLDYWHNAHGDAATILRRNVGEERYAEILRVEAELAELMKS